MSETVSIVLGYVVFFSYMLLVLGVGELFRRIFHWNEETCRKVEHLATSLSWLICYWFTKDTIHTLIINVVGFVLLAIVTLCGIFKSVERKDASKSYGVMFFGLSTAIVMAITIFVNKDFYPFTGIAYYCMALGDGFAPLFAKWFGKANFKLTKKKSFVGTCTVFVFSSLSTLVFSVAFGLQLGALMILSTGALAAVVELFSEKCTDNLTLVFFIFGYQVLNYYGLATLPLQVALVVALPFVIANGSLRALTPAANCASLIFLLFFAYFGDFPLFTTVLSLYVLSAVIGIVTSVIYNRKYGKVPRSPRNIVQILANSSICFVCITVWYFAHLQVFLWAAYAALAEEFADSAASDVGKLSPVQPRNIITFKKMQAGISGGVSLVGSLGALLGAAVAMVIPFAFGVFGWQYYCLLAAVSFVGTFADSLLGALLQVLYRCPTCGADTEAREHCGTQSVKVKGVKWIGNSMVNLLAGILTALLAAFALFI